MTAAALGTLPEWNLADLYASPDDAVFAADMKKGEAAAKAFAERYRGKLAGLSGDDLAKALKSYEALSDLLGRTGSYAQLYYVGDTTDSGRAKFYGDVNAKLTEISTQLLFFELELNRIDDKALAEKLKSKALAHYKPWIDNLLMEKPYQLDDKLEELFLEKSQTAAGAFNRLFDETMAGLRFNVNGEELSLELTLHLLVDKDEAKRKAGSDALAKTFQANLRLFTLITNTLAKDKDISDRWRGFKDIADARHLSNRVEPEVVASELWNEVCNNLSLPPIRPAQLSAHLWKHGLVEQSLGETFLFSSKHMVGIAGDYLNAKIITGWVSQANLAADFGSTADIFLQFNLAPGADAPAVEAQIAPILANYPQFNLVSNEAYFAENAAVFDPGSLPALTQQNRDRPWQSLK